MSTIEASDNLHSTIATDHVVQNTIMLPPSASSQQASRKRKHTDLSADQDAPEQPSEPSATPGEEASKAVTVQKIAAAPRCLVPVVVDQKHYCAVCKEILPASSFYPSYMQRHLACCKECARAKQIEHKRRQAEIVKIHPTRPDHTRSMLEQLRRRCSQSSHLEGSHKPLIVGFDVKVARPLLAFWKWQSALRIETSRCRRRTAAALESESCDRIDNSLSTSAPQPLTGSSEPLRWIVWAKNDLLPIEPWEVIPVTHMQALQFRNVPIAMRLRLLPNEMVQQIALRLEQLQVICTSEPGRPVSNLLELYNKTSLVADNACKNVDGGVTQ